MKARSRLVPNKGKVLRKYAGFSQYEHRHEREVGRWQTMFFLTFSMALCLGAMAFKKINQPTELLSPIPVQAQTITEIKEVVVEKVIDKNENVDTWIGEAVDEFLPNHKSEGRKIMHCLANEESQHGDDKGHGDGGKAGGPFQFHQDTWDRMRNQMIKAGFATEVGSRYDFKEAARTTTWAIANGRALEWGPILRDSKGVDFKDCPTPSWYGK